MTSSAALRPGRIGTLEVRNRIVRTAHATVLGIDGIGDDFVAYHAAAARGGVGLTVLEIGAVHPSSLGTLPAFSDDIVDGYRRLMTTVRPLGMRVFQQLWHGGALGLNATGAAPWSASATRPTGDGRVPIAMDVSQIAEVVDGFGQAARRCAEGGLDGIELQFGHGYLVQQFLSALTNRRTDAYGEHRERLAMEVLDAVRAAVGRDLPVGVRVSPEGIDGGMTSEDVAGFVRRLEADGRIDYVSVSLGGPFAYEKVMGGMHEPPGYQLAATLPVAAATTLPALVIGRLTTLAEADAVLEHDGVEFVGMTRAHIADPDLVAKSAAGQAERVRPCIACDTCYAASMSGRLACAVNPRAGREAARVARSAAPRRLVVAGGGPAGMEAARAAAELGHDVVLLERAKRIGGRLALAARAPSRGRLQALLRWYERELARLEVDVRAGEKAAIGDVLALEPDAVVVATGGRARAAASYGIRPSLALEAEDACRLTTEDVLAGTRPCQGTTLVVDDLGHVEALAVAETLLAAGSAVAFVTPHDAFAHRVALNLEPGPALGRLRAAGTFELRTRCVAVGAAGGRATLRWLDGGQDVGIAADRVVFVGAPEPDDELSAPLREAGVATAVAGDASAPAFLREAVHAGHAAAGVVDDLARSSVS